MKNILILISLFVSISNAETKYADAIVSQVEFEVEDYNLCENSYKDQFVKFEDTVFEKYCVLKPKSKKCPSGFEMSDDGEVCTGRTNKTCPKGFYESVGGILCKKNVAKPCPENYSLSPDKESCVMCEEGKIDTNKFKDICVAGVGCSKHYKCKIN